MGDVTICGSSVCSQIGKTVILILSVGEEEGVGNEFLCPGPKINFQDIDCCI